MEYYNLVHMVLLKMVVSVVTQLMKQQLLIWIFGTIPLYLQPLQIQIITIPVGSDIRMIKLDLRMETFVREVLQQLLVQ